ncbi:MAG: 3-phosphoglycerate dehydrogenase, partial [Planctomycetes bacterium]|nr:3-phosphoglycerate dehydrogenase [Planctomycetota bacterium]
MEKFRIKVLNKIAPEGLKVLGDRFIVGPEVEDPQGILVRSATVDTDAFPSLLAVARAGAGVNNISVAKATERGICVFNTPGANANAVAELVFMMLGIHARNIGNGIRFCEGLKDLPDEEIAKTVETKKSEYRGFELAGKTLGVLGLGKIGVRVANGGVYRQMRVVGFDPFPSLDNIHMLTPEVRLAGSVREVVSQANILSLHMPLSDKTKGFV